MPSERQLHSVTCKLEFTCVVKTKHSIYQQSYQALQNTCPPNTSILCLRASSHYNRRNLDSSGTAFPGYCYPGKR